MISVAGNGTGTYVAILKDPVSNATTGGTFTMAERTDIPGEYFVVPTATRLPV